MHLAHASRCIVVRYLLSTVGLPHVAVSFCEQLTAAVTQIEALMNEAGFYLAMNGSQSMHYAWGVHSSPEPSVTAHHRSFIVWLLTMVSHLT